MEKEEDALADTEVEIFAVRETEGDADDEAATETVLKLLDDTRIEGDDDVDPDSVTEAVPVLVVLIVAVVVTDCEGDDVVEYVK